MEDPPAMKFNLAMALCPSEEWSQEYRAALLEFLPGASAEAMNPDNDLVMQGRMMGDTPRQCAAFIAAYVKAHTDDK